MKSQLLDCILLDNGGPMTSITSLVDGHMLDILGCYYNIVLWGKEAGA
ncbi:MAG: hypothetical protein HQ553_14610 [Chloroflexi bacterium]|nr:hypothetical protein [Chloroflexota bacterium]